MRKLALTMALLLVPAGLAAQVCLGYPATRGQSDLGGVIRLQSSLSQFGVTYSGHYPSDVVADGLFTFDHFSAAGITSDGFTAGARLGLELRSPALPPPLSLCPYGGLSIRHQSGFSVLTIPIGIGVGTVLPLESGAPYSTGARSAAASGTSLLIFATPSVAYEHVSGNSDVYVLSEIGARFLLPGFYVGASVIVSSGGRNAVLGLNAGIPLP